MTKVAAVILADSVGDAEREARAALSNGADLAELRLDQIRNLDAAVVRRLAAAVGSRGIATVRSSDQGEGSGRADARRALLKEIFTRRFAYVDVELETDAHTVRELAGLAKRNRTTVIASCHFAESVELSKVEDTLEACRAIGSVAKVAVPVADVDAATQLVELARIHAKRKHRVIVIGMGPAGMITRALADETDQEFQYAAWGRSVASGQLSLAAAKRLRGRDPIVVGLVGHPIGHSLSPTIHDAGFAALSLPGVYLPFDVDGNALDGFLRATDRLRIRGFNVTLPHKEAIAPKLDELDGDAERLGAVNTVVVDDGWTRGHNTDVFGFRLSLRSLGLRMGGRRALVVGAGGAAKAVVDVLVREGAHVEVTNRTTRRAEVLAAGFEEPIDPVPLDALPRHGPWDLLVNATPLGTKDVAGDLPVPEAILAKVEYVYDLVYNPPTTRLLAAARRLGKPGASGLEMLLHQAAKSFELWTGRSPPDEAMRRAAKEALR